jgi:ABC-type sugar transport system ATPase subunit
MSEIRFRDVHKRYAPNLPDTIRKVDLDIEKGEFVVFVGPSGCGKSTLLRMVAGLEDITSGELSINGQRMNETPPSRRGVAMVFQSYALYPHMSVYDNMAFGLKQAKTDVGLAHDGAANRDPTCSCSMSRCPTWTLRCACKHGWKSPSCTKISAPPA